MFKGGSIWIPPRKNLFTAGMPDDIFEQSLNYKPGMENLTKRTGRKSPTTDSSREHSSKAKKEETTFPKTSLLPAFVAGFNRVLIMHKPGSTNLPALFTCCVPISAKLFTAFAHIAFFSSVLSESA